MILHVDPVAPDEPLRGHLPFGDGSLAVTSRYLERDGVPFIPVSAEVHFSRMPPETWADELAKIRAAGITVLATYLIWNHHEHERGRIRWDGQRDLRRFVELCLDAGLEVLLRIGPFAHAEARHGGFPDWLLAEPLTPRSNDPAYLREAERWYRAIGQQVAGLPLFGFQVENELYDDADHLRTLLRLAEEAGIRAPIRTATAWGGAQLPVDEVLPLYAGYSEAFWIDWDAGYDAASASNFHYSDERDEVGVGADSRDSSLLPSNLDPARYPYATCELGGGMVSAYHRRPTASPHDVAALALTKLGSGSAWQGYYMFHDGTNPGPGLQETQAAGDRNDLPEWSYDFNAPLGVAGDVREHYGLLRMQHLAIAAFGDRLAPMTLTVPPPAPVRWAVRSDGTGGFLFVTNRDSQESLPAHHDVTFEVGDISLPAVDIPSGAYFFWPFAFGWQSHTIDWATVQLVTALDDLLVVVETTGIRPRVSVDGREYDLALGSETDAGGVRIRTLHAEDGPRAQVVDGRLVLSDDIELPGGAYVESWDGAVPFHEEHPLGTARPARIGPRGRAEAPTDWSSAGRYAIDTSGLTPDGLLELTWSGDVARLLVDGIPIDDRYYTGRPWVIAAACLTGAVTVEILPLDPGAPIYLPEWARPALERQGLHRARAGRVQGPDR